MSFLEIVRFKYKSIQFNRYETFVKLKKNGEVALFVK